MAKTKAPTGLSISRSGTTFTFKWRIAGSDYANGQQLQYQKNGGAWTGISIGTTATSATLTGSDIKRLAFRVRGNQKKKIKKKNPGWSAWATSGTWAATVPELPKLEYENINANSGTFTWNTSTSDTSAAIFDHVNIQTCAIGRMGEPAEADWGAVTTGTASGSQTVPEDTEALANGNVVRWFRVQSVGPAGASAWVTEHHAYGVPAVPELLSASAETIGTTTRLTVEWNGAYDDQHPVDEINVQYVIAKPTDTALSAPSSGWEDAITVSANGSYDKVVVNIDDAIGPDECLWARIKSWHDDDSNGIYSNALLAQTGTLAAPTITANPNTTTGAVSIAIKEETDCEAACTAIFFRSEDDPGNDRLIGILPRGTTTASFTVPEIVGASATCFGAYAFVGTYNGAVITAVLMRSDSVIDSDIAAVAPEVTVTEGPRDETVRVSWTWAWEDATQAELSWSEYPEAWESTEEPKDYTVVDSMATSWVVAGLETGKRYYFRVRLINASTDDEVVGPWSDIKSYNMTGAPDRPVLTLSKSVINEGGSVIARWAYSSTDGIAQSYAEVCLVTYNGSTPVYGDVIAHADSGQNVEVTYDWETGQTYYVAVRTTSEAGVQSAWSEPVSLHVAVPCTIRLTGSSISKGSENITTTVRTDTTIYHADGTMEGGSSQQSRTRELTNGFDTEAYSYYTAGDTVVLSTAMDGTDKVMTKVTTAVNSCPVPTLKLMPITATITGAGDNGTTVLSVVRGEDYHIDRPDERDFDGFEGESIATVTIAGEGTLTITADDLVGSLDDGCLYYMIGKVYDTFGQSATFRYPFTVGWAAKAEAPGATVVIDKYMRIAKITPTVPSQWAQANCTCDIYRITADKPELVYKGATFGETYVDPYPGFGEMCGHRIVCISPDGSYVSADGLAWYDADSEDGDILEEKKMVIDVDGRQIVLPYNIELTNSWSKDFERTSYLGGSVQGDWNPAVTRDLSARTVLLRGRDLDEQLAMRDLAGYAGAAHIRTPDGSSFACDIQVRETMTYQNKRVSYQLAIQAVDPQEPDGMTLDEWLETHPVGGGI